MKQAFAQRADTQCLTSVSGELFQWESSSSLWRRAAELGNALNSQVSTVPFSNEKVKLLGVWIGSREEFVLIELASLISNIPLLPIPEKLSNSDLKCLLQTSGIKTLLVADQKQVQQLLSLPSFGDLNTLILLDPISSQFTDRVVESGLKLQPFIALFESGSKSLNVDPMTAPHHLWTVIFTPGTWQLTLLTHANAVSALVSYSDTYQLSEEDSYLSYLDPAFLFERMNLIIALYKGCWVGFHKGGRSEFASSLWVFRPTVFSALPKQLHGIYETAYEMVGGFSRIRQQLFHYALGSKLEALRSKGELIHSFYDQMVFDVFRDLLGGQTRVIFSFGPVRTQQMCDELRWFLSSPIVVGWGQTETWGIACVTNSLDIESGHVGGPAACVELKMTDVPTNEYMTHSVNEHGFLTPQGEILIRGHGVATRAVDQHGQVFSLVDADGWLHTGVVGVIAPNGSITLVDKCDQKVRLVSGVEMDLDQLEFALSSHYLVADSFAFLETNEDIHLSAVVFLCHESAKRHSTFRSLDSEFLETVHDEIVQFFEEGVKLKKLTVLTQSSDEVFDKLANPNQKRRKALSLLLPFLS